MDIVSISSEEGRLNTQHPPASIAAVPVDTLIVSDIHLGSEVSRSKLLLDTLRRYEPRRLILNGDVFEDLNFKRLDKSDWNFLSYIRKLSNPKRGCEVVWVAGNHDGAAEILSHLLGVTVYDEYIWESGGKWFLAIHGHQFDRFLTENKAISALGCWIYLAMQKMDGDSQRLTRWIKHRSKKWLHISEKLALDAINYGISRGVDYVFCGHTHQSIYMEQSNAKYYNSGCWTDVPSHYLCIDNADVSICEAS